MSVINQGRNEIRFNNSDGKCLLENWVEERAVAQLDKHDSPPGSEGMTSTQKFQGGHKGILNTDFDAKPENLTNVRVSYRPPPKPSVRQIGKREELMQQMLFEQVSQEEFHDDIDPEAGEPEPTDFRSVTMKDFNIVDFQHVPPAPSKAHDYKKDQPVTFWTEHKDKLHGVSQSKTGDTPFRKNDAFSRRIDEHWGHVEPQPYEQENYPKM